jgi:hypothetical protein
LWNKSFGGGWYLWEGGTWQEKGCRRVNMVQILCAHVCKCKNDTLKLFQEWGEEDKGE